jgi:hypothetical protein
VAEEKSELEEEYEDAEADLEGVDPEDDAIEDGEMFDDDDDEEFEEDASLEEVAESEEDDDDEVEADLSAILQERIAADDDEDDDESNESQTNSSEKVDSDEPLSAKEDEVLCQSCFTLVSQKAIDEEGACPNCGAEM